MTDLSSDPRWLRLTDPDFAAPGFRGGHFELDFDRPAAWKGGDPVRGEDDFDPDNVLSADYCVIEDKRFYLHGVSEIQIHGSGGKVFYLGCWAEVSQASFNAYVVSQDPGAALAAPMVGAFANRISGLPDTLGQACSIRPRAGAYRPLVTLNAAAHPLAQAQVRGVTLDGLLDLYKGVGIDIRAALASTH
jgi:hypothetical protein